MKTRPLEKQKAPPISALDDQRNASIAAHPSRNVTAPALLAIEPRLAEFYSSHDLDSIARELAGRLLSSARLTRQGGFDA